MRAIVVAQATAVALMFFQAGISRAQVRPMPLPKEAHEEARRSLPVLRQMVTPETYRRLGFLSVDEAQRADLEAPIRILMVRLDRLREYRAGENAGELLQDTHEVRYPISVDGQVRSSVVMHEVDGKWQVAKFGRPALTQKLTELIRRRKEKTTESFFEVKIPALGLYFLGRAEGSRVMLTSATNDPRFEVKEGEEIEAQQLFVRLVPYAKKVKTGPYISD